MSQRGHDPYDVRGNRERKDEQSERAKAAQDQADRDLAWLMGSEQGRRVVHRLLSPGQVFRRLPCDNGLRLAEATGARNSVIDLFADLHRLCPQLYLQMLEEAKDDGDAGIAGKHNGR